MTAPLMMFIDEHGIVNYDKIQALDAKHFVEAWGKAIKLRKQMEALAEAFQQEAMKRASQ